MSRRRYFEEQRSGNGAIYHCVKTEIEPGDKIRLFNLMNKVKSDTISQDKINSVLNQLREGTAFNIHTQSPVSFSFSSTSTGYEPMSIRITFDPYPTSEQQGIIYKFQINDQRYVFMFSNRYDGMRDLINNADEDVDCITSATEKSSIYITHLERNMEEEKVKDIQPEILENRRVKEMPEVVELIEIGMVVWEVNPIMMKDVESEEETEKVVVTEEADAARKEPAVMELC